MDQKAAQRIVGSPAKAHAQFINLALRCCSFLRVRTSNIATSRANTAGRRHLVSLGIDRVGEDHVPRIWGIFGAERPLGGRVVQPVVPIS